MHGVHGIPSDEDVVAARALFGELTGASDMIGRA